MTYRKATYEEYCKASKFAKVRYRFGIYIQIVAAILLLYLLFYTLTNIEEMKANPKDYAEKKLGVICMYPIQEQVNMDNIEVILDYNGG